MIDRPSPNYNERKPGKPVSILIMHYTGMRDAEAALMCTQRLIRLAHETGKRVHVLHVTTKEEVAFLAGHNALAVLPVALLLGGICASGGLLQRTFGLPDATVNVLQGILFVVLLASQTYRGQVRLFRAARA